VYYESEVKHFQIQQHGQDAFFSIDGQQPIHGLECLIEYYRINPIESWTRLKNYVKKDPPPINTRRHGVSNLLHRATKHNQLTVVKEMLKMSYRNLDAKDENGMTAVHLSCKHSVSPEILQLLIDRGANVATRDSYGNTPLHVSKNYHDKMFQLVNEDFLSHVIIH
jgi:tyrosine-protein kinase shark